MHQLGQFLSIESGTGKYSQGIACSVLEITFLAGSKYLLPSVKVGSKLTLVAKYGGHITAHLPSVQVVVRFKTKQNPIWSNAFDHYGIMFSLMSSQIFFKRKLASTSQNYFHNRISRQQLFATYLFHR